MITRFQTLLSTASCATIARGVAINAPYPPPGEAGYLPPPPVVLVQVEGQPPVTAAPMPPPPTYRPLSSLEVGRCRLTPG